MSPTVSAPFSQPLLLLSMPPAMLKPHSLRARALHACVREIAVRLECRRAVFEGCLDLYTAGASAGLHCGCRRTVSLRRAAMAPRSSYVRHAYIHAYKASSHKDKASVPPPAPRMLLMDSEAPASVGPGGQSRLASRAAHTCCCCASPRSSRQIQQGNTSAPRIGEKCTMRTLQCAERRAITSNAVLRSA